MITEHLDWLSELEVKKAYKKGALFAGKTEDCPLNYKHLLQQEGEIIIDIKKNYFIIRKN